MLFTIIVLLFHVLYIGWKSKEVESSIKDSIQDSTKELNIQL